MTRPLNDGGPAFPQTHLKPNKNGVFHPEAVMGMTLRDYFAGQVLAAVVHVCRREVRADGETIPQFFARSAYEVADAMLEARGRQAGEP